MAAILRPLRRVEEAQDDIAIDSTHYKPRVPDGEYRAVMLGHQTAFVFRTAKVFLRFRIIDPGPHFETELFKAYRVHKLRGKPGPGGQISLRPQGELFTDLVRLLHIRRRPDRMSLRDLKGCVWKVRTRTVTVDYQQRPLPEWMQYSTVDEIIQAETGAQQ